MRVAIVTNLAGKGLQVDAELLQGYLVELSHTVTLIQFDQPWPDADDVYDLGISLELVQSHFFSQATRWWWIPNPEWTRPEYIRPAQRGFEKVLAKTRDGERALRELFSNVHYTGFLARDRRDQSVPRENRCLHVGGDSGFKNTAEVIAAWREYRYWDQSEMPPLTIVSKSITVTHEKTPGVTFLKQVEDEELVRLQNSHRFHVIPSSYEGYGHALHEAESVGAVILTTNAGPMAEVSAPFSVPSVGGKRNNLGTLHEISPADLRERVPEMMKQPSHVIARMGIEARLRFERGNKAFKEALAALLLAPSASVAAGVAPRTQIALLGNFGPPYSTENDLLWTLRDMGYGVRPFQENQDRTEEILLGCKGVALLIYVHTHGWQTPGILSLDQLWAGLRDQGTKTCSFHLDRYWGLDKLDQRETRIGTHPFWRTDAVFTADGGNQEKFAARGINHHWLPPGVIKRECVLGTTAPELTIDVGFVGAEGYHPEYPFRGELIQFLRSVYGERFRLYQGYRGNALNQLYASIRVVVGDSCFAGSDRYWSDRCPETTGRFGFLIHPQTVGLRIPGLITYEPGNLYDLQDKIDYYLVHEEERRACILAASSWVKANETYHNRMVTLLQKMNIDAIQK